MGEATSFLSLVACEVCASNARRLCAGNRSARQTTGSCVVRGPGELVVGSPKPVELEPKLRAARVGTLGRRVRLVCGTRTGAAVAHRHG